MTQAVTTDKRRVFLNIATSGYTEINLPANGDRTTKNELAATYVAYMCYLTKRERKKERKTKYTVYLLLPLLTTLRSRYANLTEPSCKRNKRVTYTLLYPVTLYVLNLRSYIIVQT